MSNEPEQCRCGQAKFEGHKCPTLPKVTKVQIIEGYTDLLPDGAIIDSDARDYDFAYPFTKYQHNDKQIKVRITVEVIDE